MMSKTEKSSNDLTYEQAFIELEEIVNAMENQQLPLDESMRLFERGQMLAQHCATLLDRAELKIKELSSSKNSVENED